MSVKTDVPAIRRNMRRYVAELIGTFVLVFGGCGAAVIAGPIIGAAGVALAFGLSLLIMVYAIGPISGCHVNPAVTLGMYLNRRIEQRDAWFYVAAQLLGAVLASGILVLIMQGSPGGYSAPIAGLAANGYGLHSPGGFSLSAAFLMEVILTGVFVLTVLRTTDREAPVGFAGLSIGLALTLVYLVGIPVTNTSVNPARSFGPAVFVGGWAMGQLWLFFLAPLIGAAFAAWIYQSLQSGRVSSGRVESIEERIQEQRRKAR